ncbi:MAG: FtsX-like permease family protein [Myxococcales bacterium]
MIMLLGRKLIREIVRAKGQTAALLLVEGLGVLLFVASAAAYLDLRDSYAHTRQELALAGLHIDVTGVSAQDVRRIAALPGVSSATARVVAELPVEVNHGKVSLRVLTLPDGKEPTLDRVLVLSGRLPQGQNEILVEKHMAQHFQLQPGATLAIDAGGVRRSLTVVGTAESAEYLWVTRDDNDIFPNPDSFGVGWMGREELRSLAASMLTPPPALPGLAIAAGAQEGNQLLVQPSSVAEEGAVLSAVKELVGSRAFLAATPASKLPGLRLLQMDVDGYKEMAAFFPLFFLGIGGFIVASIIARLVDAQRSLIGTFASLGVGRFRILFHYLGYALVLGGAGAALGAIGSVPTATAMTRAYAEDLGIPFVVTRIHWRLVGEGVLAALAVAFLSGLVPALHASALPPAEAMRPPRPSAGPLARLTRGFGGPLAVRLAARSVLGRPFRSLGTAVGVSAALVLVLTTGGMLDSMTTTFDAIFDGSQRYDIRIDLTGPTPSSVLRQDIADLEGVQRSELFAAAPVSLRAGSHLARALLQALPVGSQLVRSIDLDGSDVDPPAGGIVLTRALARQLGVTVGDDVAVDVASAPREGRFRVSGFADAAVGNTATVRLADAQRAVGLGEEVTAVALRVRGDSRAAVKRAVSDWPDAAEVQDVGTFREQIGSLMALGWVFLFVMLTCGVVLAAAILFNTATLAILERRRDLATLRALGRTLREISAALTIENGILALLGLGLGLPLSVWATKAMLALYSSDLFTLPFVLSPRTLAAACAGVVGVLLMAQWPALRRLGRESVAEAVRVREG